MSSPAADRSRQIADYLDGTLAPAEMPGFRDWLNADDAHARQLVEQMLLESHLRQSAPASVTFPPARPASADRTHRFRQSPTTLALAAAVLLAAAAVAVYVFIITPGPSDAPALDRPVATLVDSTGLVLIDDDVANQGDDYRPGTYAIRSGFAEFQLTSGASVRLIGPTRLRIHDDMSSTLDRGVAAFRCPPSAVGYTVGLGDGTRVVDLGTEFIVFAEPGAGRAVFVREGRVDLRNDRFALKRITAGQLAGLDAVDTWTTVDGLDPALGILWESPTAIGALLPHLIEADGSLVLYESFLAGDADGRSAYERAAPITADHDPVTFDITEGHRQLTIAAWVKLEPGVKPFRVLGMSDSWGPPGSFAWDIRDGKRLCLAIGGIPQPHYEADIEFDPSRFGTWLHVAVVYDAERGAVEHYLNGEPVKQLPIANGPALRPGKFGLGQWRLQPARALDGAMDDFIMIDAALTPKQVHALWRLTAPPTTEERPTPGELP